MSYTPYPPETSAPTALQERRKGFWLRLVLVLICIAPPAFYYGWRFWPVQPREPLARIALANGKELRLVAVEEGEILAMEGAESFEDRVIWDGHDYRHSRRSWQAESAQSAWMIFTIYDPVRKAFEAPRFTSFAILDEAGVVFHGDVNRVNGTQGGMPPVAGVVFNLLPRRPENFNVRIGLRQGSQDVVLRNSFQNSESPQFTAQTLPQMQSVDGAEIRLNAVSLIKKPPQAKQPPVNFDVRLDLSAKVMGLEGYPLSITRTLFDPTGNRSPYMALPPADRVWGVNVQAREPLNFPFPPAQRLALAKLSLPGPGQAVQIPLPTELIRSGLVDLYILGSGHFHWERGLLKSTAPSTGLTTDLGHVAISSSGNWNSDVLTVLSVENQDRRQDSERSILIRCRGEILQSSISSRSGSSNLVSLYSRYRGLAQRTPLAGEAMEIEMVFPKERTATFYFERPSFPEEASKPHRP